MYFAFAVKAVNQYRGNLQRRMRFNKLWKPRYESGKQALA
jgi:hypothetical protein